MSTDPNHPLLHMYRDLKHAHQLHESSNVFLTDGEKITLSIMQSALEIKSLVLTESLYQKHAQLIDSHVSKEHVLIMNKREIDALVGFNVHSPMMSIIRIPNFVDIQTLKPQIIAMNGIVNSENVGGIIRNAIAFDCDSIIVDAMTSSPYLRRSVRVSMGSIAFSNIASSSSLAADLIRLKQSKGLTIISAEISDQSIPIHHYDFPQDFILVFGSEGHGISEEILAISDKIVHIPISNRVKSLNVAATSAVFLQYAMKGFSGRK